ncbi:Arsenite resistance protein ArsB, partial [Leucoagaricus sp. SymC.cos]
QLSVLDRLLSPLILLAMISGVILGEFVPSFRERLDTVHFDSVSAPIAIGLVVMMWPALTKVQYEKLPGLFSSIKLWMHIGISLVLNWLIGPFLMLGLAWATLPDLPNYRTGVIMVGLARCIAMVMIWNSIAQGDTEYCAILVVLNAILQIILYSPFAVLFINIIGDQGENIHVSYGKVAISVLIYLGIPLAAGLFTRYIIWFTAGKQFLVKKFLPFLSPVALLGLLYTIVVLFAYQGHQIIHNIGSVFRLFVPLILYFIIMWSSALTFMYYLSRREGQQGQNFGYSIAISQAFTAASNNFELAIAVAIAVYGVNSQQALAATIGPLVEVPVLLALTWVALLSKHKLGWQRLDDSAETKHAA